ncbi:unnamed protein product [Rotaria magnacalcarata]|uniref:NudC domain-containing protein 1 n=1 Tax=Rotaria magnacalcarata TaxID=392030 RepID=A0A816N8Y1_9BILA|nr:unnamed protein product [Rotaria magnacalcarata]CAF4072660.1 unnamed protein product [Rotaria magnacalcarata]
MPEHELDLSTLSLAYKTVTHSDKDFLPLTANDQYLLLRQHPNLCFYDQEMNLVKETLWSHGNIWDMCWSLAIEKFIILEENSIFLLDENTMSIDNIYTIEGRTWVSCTCSNTILYAVTHEWGPSIMEFKLLPTIELTKKWTHPVTCTEDKLINDIGYNNGSIALLVDSKPDISLRIDLRYKKTLDRIWSLRLDIKDVGDTIFRFCPLTCHEWPVVDHKQARLLQITTDGKMKKTGKYQSKPYRATLLYFVFEELA